MATTSIDQDLDFLTTLDATRSAYWFETFCTLQKVSKATAKTCLAKTSFYSGRWRLARKDDDLPSRFRDILNDILKVSQRRSLRTVAEEEGHFSILGTDLPLDQDVLSVETIDSEVALDARYDFPVTWFRGLTVLGNAFSGKTFDNSSTASLSLAPTSVSSSLTGMGFSSLLP